MNLQKTTVPYVQSNCGKGTILLIYNLFLLTIPSYRQYKTRPLTSHGIVLV